MISPRLIVQMEHQRNAWIEQELLSRERMLIMLGRAREEDTGHSIQATWEWGAVWRVGLSPHKSTDL